MTNRNDGPDVSLIPPGSAASPDGFDVWVANTQEQVPVDDGFLCEVTRSVLACEGIDAAEISLAVVTDPEIHEINRRYLGHDHPTDVISFLLSERDESESIEPARQIDGEIVMSGETAMRTAGEFGCSPRDELTLYLVHGLLHLCGYDDQTENDRESMRARERVHLQKVGIEPHY